MRILARIVVLPFAVFFIALGGFGLLASSGTKTETAEQTRRQLQTLNRWAIEQGVDVPRDFSVTTEEWVAETFLRFVLLPLGLVSILFVVGLLGRKSEQPAEAKDPKGTEATPTTDKRAAKRIRKQANALKKKGEIIEGAELLWDHEQHDAAVDFFIEAGEFVRAAEIRHDQNLFTESADLHFRGENYESAGSIYGQQEQWSKAADCYMKADLKSVAAEMFEKAEMFRQAADCYRETDFMRHAAAMFVKCKNWRAAGECLETVFIDEGGKSTMDPKKAAELSKLVRQAGKLFLKAEDVEKAFEIFERGGCALEAAEVAQSLGNHEAAAQHFRSAGNIERAAEALRESGSVADAARLLGQHLRDGGESERAAVLLEEAGDDLEAGDLYRNLEQFEKAAECYQRQHGFMQAAEMYQLAGDRENAAGAFEKAGRFTEAAECFALVGNPAREAELLEKAGDFLRAGEINHEHALDEEAILVLQKVVQEDEEFARAAAILGDIFAARGQLSLAVTKLQQAIGDTELTRDSVDGYYKLATIYQEDQKHRDAVEIFEKVMAFDYHYRDVEQRLAETRALLSEEEPLGVTHQGRGDGTASGAESGGSAEDNRYQIVGELGRGGMGIVYKVRDIVLDRLVAFKVLPQTLTENPQAIANFMREAQAAAKLNHPNIVTVYDTGEQQGRYYIAMEYVEGTTVKEILRRRGVISPSGILHVLVQICEALSYAHEKKVVHRDIKPANAMWTRDKKAKLMDFGLAKVIEEARNQTTVVAGTPYYMSPEQTLGKNIDHRTDIYSLGVSIFEMATGTVPFKEGNIPYHHVHTAPPTICEIRRDLPEALSGIVARCLEKDPGNRFQSAGEILTEVRQSLVGSIKGDSTVS
ncbi:MAG TPA: tetratricopeptide repeat protein [Myxococcales bacterium]|nr:tetratricopeptide repeat protein [Myxococcales bacterium]HIK83888.1 tetratricopeptide repeat protein [Myxococcales bacterium]